MRKSIVEYVYEHSVRTPLKTAVIAAGKETTYGELFQLVSGYCEYLKRNGLKRGDIVVARASQGIDYAVLYLATHLTGGVIASLEKRLPSENFREVAEKLGARFIITDDDIPDTNGCVVLPREGIVATAEKNYVERDRYTFPDENDSADILFTTGTTGASKGVELTHKALTATAENLIEGCGYREDTVLVLPGPLNHANAIRKLFTTFVNGSTIIILNGMTSVKKFFDALDYPKGRIACCLPPSAIRMIFQTTQNKLGEYADRIDFIESATSPLPEPDKERLCELLPRTRLYNNYGSSEAASVCMYDYNKFRGLTGCVGKPAKNAQILIVDDERKEIRSSKENMGLIACRGDVNMRGYINDPDATAEVLANGIVYTNDMGYIDKDGFVYVSGRKGDVINVGGLKVAPTEVESAALAYDQVEDCICIGVDDPISGKALKLLLVLREGETLQPKQLRNHLQTRLESYKVPAIYEQVQSIARTFNGKLDRKYYYEK